MTSGQILLETLLEVVIGVMVMEVDKVADEVTSMEVVLGLDPALILALRRR